ncbi:MAG: PA0069 family radical SAM protein [Bdellovibrionales bacterium]|nr:PA0069 family radical SAM protein [Bdellovibrionales bacterium]
MLRRVSNPPNPYSLSTVEYLGEQPPVKLTVFEEAAASIISRNKSPDIGFEYSINPYRGCFHACSYCYARPTHQYIDFGAGTDFERKIVIKVNAAERLREAFMKRSWKGDTLVFSGVTDCYQPLEASYELTRKCLEVCLEFRNPVSIITKGALILRDLELLRELNQAARAHVTISLAFSDGEMARAVEPHAPHPSARLRALRELSSAGIKTAVALSPIIPGLNDTQIPEVLQRASDAGAQTAFMTLLRLPAEVKDVFLERTKEAFPQRFGKIVSSITAMKAGQLNRSQFGKRMQGEGQRWDAISWLFDSSCERLGLNSGEIHEVANSEQVATFRRPTPQLDMFDS